MNINFKYTDEQAYNDLIKCTICPRMCKSNRVNGPLGYCKIDSGFNISNICIHTGEEPVISGKTGICNVFFSHCNLQCIFCQNYQISQNGTRISQYGTLDQITEQIITLLDKGCTSVGFVSASHMVPQMVLIINSLHRRGRYPAIVYNSNGYDSVETLRRLEGLVDIYLPDFKYINNELGKAYSDVKDYSSVAGEALKEMYRQMGPKIITDQDETAVRGLIIRHLVLPGEVNNSIKALRFIAKELSPKISISLMAQYHPIYKAVGHKTLGRTISVEEYNAVVAEMERLGFENGWIQELESSSEYLPDFEKCEHPFERSS
jgi:putative pyruvate formate lyase activating enzyme